MESIFPQVMDKERKRVRELISVMVTISEAIKKFILSILVGKKVFFVLHLVKQ